MRESRAFDDLGLHSVDSEVSARIKRSLAGSSSHVIPLTPSDNSPKYDLNAALNLARKYGPFLGSVDLCSKDIIKEFFSELEATRYPTIPKDFDKLTMDQAYYNHFSPTIETIALDYAEAR